MGEVFQGINSRVSKTSIQSELIDSSLNNITRNSKNVINIEISEPPQPPYNDPITETTYISIVSDINESEFREGINTTKTNINVEVYERELNKGVCYADVTQLMNLIEIETPLSNITRSSKTAINLEISAPPYPPYNDSTIEVTNNPLVIDIYEPPLFLENTIMYGDIPIVNIYYGDIPITKVYKGDTLIKDFNIE